MKITVLSGKGGTGKTTVSTNLAASLDNVQLIDADVEEPNAYIFMNPDFGEEYESVMRKVPVVNQELCVSCRACVGFCQYNGLALLGGEVLVFEEICHSCGGCKYVCSNNAITEKQIEVGRVKSDQKNHNLEFWQGELNIGEESAVPVISALKEDIKGEKIVIIDAPPGTTCPTVEAVVDSDYAIVVTEPTPFGLHDLKMAIELIRELNIPCGVIINRSEILFDNIIEDYCQQEGIDILLRIPFSKKIAKLYSQGKVFVKVMPEWKDKFKSVLRYIEQVLQ